MWILQLFVFLGAVYLLYKPQLLLVLFFKGCQFLFQVYLFISYVCRQFKAWFQKLRRYYLLRTKKFEERVVMQPPNLSAAAKKRF